MMSVLRIARRSEMLIFLSERRVRGDVQFRLGRAKQGQGQGKGFNMIWESPRHGKRMGNGRVGL